MSYSEFSTQNADERRRSSAQYRHDMIHSMRVATAEAKWT
jgi:hypothetical protein